MRFPRWLAATLIVAALAGGGLYWALRPNPSITVVSWGDVYGRAQTLAMFHPFTDKTHVDVNIGNYGGGLKELNQQVSSGRIDWDVVDLELEDAAAACRQGLLEPLLGIELPAGANGTSATRDFVPGAVGRCWIASVAYSQVIGVDSTRYEERQPRTAADFFDLERFPGPRGMRDGGPKFNLELALIADGVPPWQVYGVLGTKAGADRAFAKLDTIKANIKWWRRAAEPAEWLARGEVAMTTVLNARIFSIDPEPKIRTLWDGQLYQFDVFGIPKGDPNKQRALEFIRFATSARPLAEMAQLLPYGPARQSAVALVGRNPETNAEMRPYLPTAAYNFRRALAVDPDWWANRGAALQTRWNEWRKQPPPSP